MTKSLVSSAKRLCEAFGELLLVLRALARVLDRQRGDDDEHLAQHTALVGLDDHARVARVDRQGRDGAAVCRQAASRTPATSRGGGLVVLGREGLRAPRAAGRRR